MLSKKQPFSERPLTWRFWRQSAIRKGDWKLLKFRDRATYLFDLSKDPGEKSNLVEKHPEIAAKLEAELATWNSSLCAPDPGSPEEYAFYNRYFNLPMPGK
jgi:arylsulfatase A-like enzyme